MSLSRDSTTLKYRARWIQAVNSTMKYLASPSTHSPPFTYLAQFRDHVLINEMGHLTCFAAGNFMLGGAVTGNPSFTAFGKLILDTCHHTYASSPIGVGPEYFAWMPSS